VAWKADLWRPVKNFLRCVERLQKVETQMRPSPAGPEAHKDNPTTTENSDTRHLNGRISPIERDLIHLVRSDSDPQFPKNRHRTR